MGQTSDRPSKIPPMCETWHGSYADAMIDVSQRTEKKLSKRKIGIEPKRVQHIYHELDTEDHNTNNYVGIIFYLTKDDVNVILTVSWKL